MEMFEDDQQETLLTIAVIMENAEKMIALWTKIDELTFIPSELAEEMLSTSAVHVWLWRTMKNSMIIGAQVVGDPELEEASRKIGERVVGLDEP